MRRLFAAPMECHVFQLAKRTGRLTKRSSIRKGRQVAGVPLRLTPAGGVEVLLVTSRETRRWIVPKGWPMKGLKDHRAARVEVREEAGVDGRVLAGPIGAYRYWRRGRLFFRLTCVEVFAVAVSRESAAWKEHGQRERRWCDVLTAADLVSEPELSTLLVRLPLDEGVMKFLRKKRAPKRPKADPAPVPP